MARICQTCGSELEETAKFCSKCGSKYEDKPDAAEVNVCRRCGKTLEMNMKFCPYCGANQAAGSDDNIIGKGIHEFTSTINQMAGEDGEVKIHIKELFSEVFKKHTLEEEEEIFICGTSKTTPKEKDMITEWPRPWLYSRVLLMLLVVFMGLYVMIRYFGNPYAMPGAMFIGAMAVPFAAVVFLWEMNVPRNINVLEIVSTFFVGGVFSLICTLALFSIVGSGDTSTYIGALIVGVIEEIGKIIVVGYYIKKKNCKYILNGLLLGACVGAGFAVFETAGYAFYYGLVMRGTFDSTLSILLLRGKLAIGGHVAWAAISGAGLVAAKGEELLRTDHWKNPRFLKFLIFVIILHGVWDMPILYGSNYNLVQWCLTGIAVLTVLTLLFSGIRQVTRIVEKARAEENSKMAEE